MFRKKLQNEETAIYSRVNKSFRPKITRTLSLLCVFSYENKLIKLETKKRHERTTVTIQIYPLEVLFSLLFEINSASKRNKQHEAVLNCHLRDFRFQRLHFETGVVVTGHWCCGRRHSLKYTLEMYDRTLRRPSHEILSQHRRDSTIH